MLKFVEKINYIEFTQLNSVAIPVNITDKKEVIKFARQQVNASKSVLDGFSQLFEVLCRTSRPEPTAIAMTELLVERSLEEQNYFVNSIIGGFKLLADFYNSDKQRFDQRNSASYEMLDGIINLGTPSGTPPTYKSASIAEGYPNAISESKVEIEPSIHIIFDTVRNPNIVSSIFFTALTNQHPTHQQCILTNLMAFFHIYEDKIEQSCLKYKVMFINNHNTFLSYC
jgi:hypothetical protein